MTIRFPGYGDKRFLYPDAFETDLKACDQEVSMAVQQDLSRKRAVIHAEQLRKEQLYEEEKQRKAEEKARLAAQKKKSASKAKSSAAKLVAAAK